MRTVQLPSVFRKFLLSYVLILMIPNIAGYISYRTSIDAAEASSIETGIMVLEQSQAILEQRMAEVEGFTKQLAINQDIIKLISENKQGDSYNVFGLWKAARDVADYSQTNDFLENFYIYLNNYDVIVAPGTVYFRPEHYYAINHYEEMTVQQWKTSIIDTTHEHDILPLQPFIQNKKAQSVITFAQSIPLNSFNNPQGTIVVLINEKSISSLLATVSTQYGGWAFITDNEGHTLATEGIDQEDIAKWMPSSEAVGQPQTSRFERDTLLVTIRSEKTGWLYTAGIPKEALMKNANVIKFRTWTLSAGAIVIGLLIGLLLAYRNSAPITRLLNVFKEQYGPETDHTRNEYDFLTGNISKLITNNRLLRTELNAQIPLLRDAFLKRLLAGEFHSSQELEAVSSQTGVLLDNPGYAAIIKINGYGGADSKEIIQELSAARLFIRQTLIEMDEGIHMSDLGSEQLTVLFTAGEEAPSDGMEKVTAKLKQLEEKMYTSYRISISAGIGGLYHMPSEVSRSYEEARQAIDHAIYTDEKAIMWFHPSMRETAMYFYPIDTEQRLLNTIKAGDREEAERIVASVFTHNFSGRELSREMTEQLIGELRGTLLKLLDQKPFQDADVAQTLQARIVQIHPVDGIEQVRHSMEHIVQQLCEFIMKKRNDWRHETVSEIVSFIESAYSDPDLTLYQIAEVTGRPEKYISQLFKEQTGDNLSDYLERMRINRASELLQGNELTIDDIALQVGYNSSHSFRRAFKRVRGIPPSQYRQSTE